MSNQLCVAAFASIAALAALCLGAPAFEERSSGAASFPMGVAADIALPAAPSFLTR